LHVAVLDEELPYPLTSGKRIRSFNLLARLARRHRVTYLCHRNADPAEVEQAQDVFATHGIHTVVVDRAVPPRSGLRFYARLAANLLSPLPYSVASHTSAALTEAVSRYAAQHRVDLWHCEWTPYAETLRHLPGAPHVVMAHNVESLIWQRYWENESNPLKRWYIGRQHAKFAQFERRVLRRATRTVAVSAEDARHFHRQFDVAQADVVDNGVDVNYFVPDPKTPTHPARLIFMGSLDWRPNLDAVEQLFQRVYPAVQQLRPETEWLIVGRNPPPALSRRIEEMPGVKLHANVPDVRPLLRSSTALVVPLRIGGGSRLKILEALASGVPVISTRIGAEGLNLEPEKHLTVVDDVAALAPVILSGLTDPLRLRLQAGEGRGRVVEQYDWEELSRRLEQIWIDCAGEGCHS